jgi:hypothetical protein
MTSRDTQQHEPNVEQIIETVASWSNITTDTERFNATRFILAGREIGHLHPRLADIGYPQPLRDQLIAEGQTEEHHVVPQHPNATTFHIESADDLDHVVWLFRLSYLARVASLQQREDTESTLPAIDVHKEVDELAPSAAVRSAFKTAATDVS